MSEIYDRIRSCTYLFEISIVMVIVDVIPLTYGLNKGNLVVTLLSGVLMLGGIATIAIIGVRANRLSDEMLGASEQELQEMTEGLDLLENPSPSDKLH